MGGPQRREYSKKDLWFSSCKVLRCWPLKDCAVGHQNHHNECIVVCWCVKMTRKFGKSKSTFTWEVYNLTRQMSAFCWWVRTHGRSKVAHAQTTVCGGKLLKYCLHPFQGVRHPNRVSGFSSKSSFMCETWLACIRVSHICYKQQVSYESYLDWPTGFPVKRDGIGCFYICNHCTCGLWLRT